MIETQLPPGRALLDFIRYDQHQTGTKIGCREGDCGACTVLVGEIIDGRLRYRSMTSCLMPLGNANGKHIVTVEGINMQELNPVQQAMAEEGATQCGFCTPGFVMSLVGFTLHNSIVEPEAEVIAAIDGNICRCTGYKSIERAAQKVATLVGKQLTDDPTQQAVAKGILPDYFTSIKSRLESLSVEKIAAQQGKVVFTGGGTDLYVQRHDSMTEANIQFTYQEKEMKSISVAGVSCTIGGSVTVTDLCESEVIRKAFPSFLKHAKLVSSTPIRNMATLAGNFVNASPIGDFTAFFLALDTVLVLSGPSGKREVALKDFYKGYKQLDKKEDEVVSAICFTLPGPSVKFNFEKVSKRTHLDIASVNSAMSLQMKDGIIDDVRLSAGGVAPVPYFMKETISFLKGKKPEKDIIEQAIQVAQSEVSPISDARGTAAYKRLLLGQLIRAHFMILTS